VSQHDITARVAAIVESLFDANQPGNIEGQIRHVMQCLRDDIAAEYGDKQSHRTTLAEERLKVMIRLAIDNERKARDDGREALAREQQLRYARNALERIADGREQDAPKFAKVALAHVFGPTPTPMDASVMKRITTQLEPSTPAAECWCEKCRPNTIGYMRMIVCPDCGNKRCPKATNHENACTGSNEVGQKGSSWEHVKAPEPVEQKPRLVGYDECRCILTQYCDGKCRPRFEVPKS
jgi:hypothetical protein